MDLPIVLKGRISYRRAVSKKLVFYDVLCDAGDHSIIGQSSSRAWVEVVVKADVYGSVQNVKDARDSLKLGDIVAVAGNYENEHTLLATGISVLHAWRVSSPDVAFLPQPSGLHRRLDQPKEQAQHNNKHKGQQQTLLHTCAAEQEYGQQQAGLQPTSSAAGDMVAAVQEQTATTSTHEAETAGVAVEDHTSPVTNAPQPTLPGPTPTAASLLRLRGPQLPVCKFWLNSGRCAKGAACAYEHLQASALRPTKATWLKERQQQRQMLSSSLGYCHTQSAAVKGQRAQLFATWLVETFGKETLSAGAGVLDVAGGAGGMTFQLAVVHGVRCTLVEPRPLKLNKQQHKQLQLLGKTASLTSWTAEQVQQSVNTKQRDFPQTQLPGVTTQLHPQSEQHELAIYASQEPQHGRHSLSAGRAATADSGGAAHDVSEGAGGDTDSSSIVHLYQLQGWFGPELWCSPAWQQLLGHCSLVIGLHPDQATEPLVDYAMEMHKPFAVVPCCVFPRQFPDRRLLRHNESVPVVAYAELIEYLRSKGHMKQHTLGFEGANTVLYRL